MESVSDSNKKCKGFSFKALLCQLKFLGKLDHHADTFLLAIGIAFLVIVACVFVGVDVTKKNALGIASLLIIICIFVIAYKKTDTVLEFNLQTYCQGENGDNFFSLNVDTKFLGMLSFVYYYILMYVKAIITLIIVFAFFYILSVLIEAELGYKHTNLFGITSYYRFGPSHTKYQWYLCVVPAILLIIEVLSNSFYFIPDLIYKMMYKRDLINTTKTNLAHLKLSSQDLNNTIISMDKKGDFEVELFKPTLESLHKYLSPQQLLQYANFDEAKMTMHATIFVIGLITSILYSLFVIKALPDVCESRNTETNAEFQNQFSFGFFIIITLIIVLYFILLVKESMEMLA